MTNRKQQPYKDVTFFTTCKPFKGSASVLQNNALFSWHKLGFTFLIIGDDEGAADTASKLGATFIPDVLRNEKNTPLVSDIFKKAKENSRTPFLAYINADIVLDVTFAKTLEALMLNDISKGDILLTARRKNIPLYDSLYASEKWQQNIRKLDEVHGSWDQENAIDIFVFNRSLLTEIPDFAIGRMNWDNWLLWRAKQQGAYVIDASMHSPIYHPIHGYASHGEGWATVAYGSETQKNRHLASGKGLNLEQATTHIMDKNGHVYEISKSNLKTLKSYCKPEPIKEFTAGLKYIESQSEAYKPAEIEDFMRTVLWRNKLFFPSYTTTSVDKENLNNTIRAATKAIHKNDTVSATYIIQDYICRLLLKKVKSCKNPILIWGSGEAGMRGYAFLARHNINISGFIDSSKEKWEQEIKGADGHIVYSPSHIEMLLDLKPIIIIASVYAPEITETIQNMLPIDQITIFK